MASACPPLAACIGRSFDLDLLAQLQAAREISVAVSKMGLEFLNLGPGGAQKFFHAPRTRMNERVEYDTRAIATCSLPLDRTRLMGEKTGAKVNDIVLTVIDAALHEYLEEKGENTRTPLVALCPMSLREEGDSSASTQATALHIRLGDPVSPIRERLQQVVDSSRAIKEENLEKAITLSERKEFGSSHVARVLGGALGEDARKAAEALRNLGYVDVDDDE